MKSRFTLVEILVTIAIIVILLSIISPIIGYLKRAKITEAKIEMKHIQSAIYDFYNTYKQLPVIPVMESIPLTPMELTALYNELSANISATINTRQIVFYTSSQSTPFLDPWDIVYNIFFDINYDQRVTIPDSTNILQIKGANFIEPIKGRVAIYTAGTDENLLNADINNWER